MQVSRRQFFKMTGATAGGLLLPFGFAAAAAPVRFPLHKPRGEARSICPYCSVGCGLLVQTDETGHILNIEGDPDHIVNRGALDPKSISAHQLSTSSARLDRVLYRAPYAADWEEKDWNWAIEQVAKRIKTTRDSTFKKTNDSGVTVNRCDGIAFLGGAANNDEDCYLAVKLTRALGLAWIEHQARI